MSQIKQSQDCTICCEHFTLHKRVPIECPKCSFISCKTCIQTYILSKETLNGVPCMNPECDCVWSRSFLIQHFPNAFVNKTYRQHQSNLLFHQELSRMSETMPYVERRQQSEKIRDEIKIISKEKDAIQILYSNIKKKEEQLRHKRWELENDKTNIKKEAREFIRRCPADGCRGFLSKGWKCKICSVRVCSKCHEIKANEKGGGGANNEAQTHVCKEDNLKSVELLKKDTKNCPSCGCMIHKISGCDQMWCTQCQVAFSWRTGCRVHGVVHNPHFFQWQRQNGGAERTAGDVRCGGYPHVHTFWNKILGLPKVDRRECSNLLREMIHFNRYELPRFRQMNTYQNDKKRDFRIKYILNQIDEKGLKSRLVALNMKCNKERDIYHVMELMDNIAMERMIAIHNHPSLDEFQKSKNECDRVRKYCNEELLKISNLYNNQCVPFISEHYYCNHNQKFKVK